MGHIVQEGVGSLDVILLKSAQTLKLPSRNITEDVCHSSWCFDLEVDWNWKMFDLQPSVEDIQVKTFKFLQNNSPTRQSQLFFN